MPRNRDKCGDKKNYTPPKRSQFLYPAIRPNTRKPQGAMLFNRKSSIVPLDTLRPSKDYTKASMLEVAHVRCEDGTYSKTDRVVITPRKIKGTWKDYNKQIRYAKFLAK